MATKIKSKKEEVLKTEKNVVVFMTPIKKLRIWVKPDYYEMAGPVRIPVIGKYIDFDDEGKFATSDKELIQFLRNHQWYNLPGKFYEVEEE